LAWTVADLAGHAAPTADDVEAAWGLRHSSAVPLHRVAAGRRFSADQVPA
jgi:hypothetical protein